MHKLIFALVFTAVAANANARGTDGFGFLQCGVKLGGKYLTYSAAAQEKSRKDSRLNHVAGMVRTEPVGFTLAQDNNPSSAAGRTGSPSTIDFRLPPKITVATIGCSWL